MKSQLHETLLQLEELNDAQELEISRVELFNYKLNEQLKKSMIALEEANNLLETQSMKHKTDMEEVHLKIYISVITHTHARARTRCNKLW